jgi:hypothetical protein
MFMENFLKVQCFPKQHSTQMWWGCQQHDYCWGFQRSCCWSGSLPGSCSV